MRGKLRDDLAGRVGFWRFVFPPRQDDWIMDWRGTVVFFLGSVLVAEVLVALIGVLLGWWA